jgi:hypothetical protein
MAAPYSELPTWLWVVLIAPGAFCLGTLVGGWWPKGVRQWRLWGATLACFTAFCLLMICVFHYKA